jgi:hypothetical protein
MGLCGLILAIAMVDIAVRLPDDEVSTTRRRDDPWSR